MPAQKSKDGKNTPAKTKKNKIDQQIIIDRFFSEKYSYSVTADHLAAELHYSKTHVNRLLRQDFGMTFSEKLDQTRLHAAKQYLRETKEPIHQIAERCGYSTLRGFEMFFKKYTGLLPKEYRKGAGLMPHCPINACLKDLYGDTFSDCRIGGQGNFRFNSIFFIN